MITPADVTRRGVSTCWNCNAISVFRHSRICSLASLPINSSQNALRSPKPMPLMMALLDQMRAERIIVPAFSTVENLAWEILTRAEATIFGQLTVGLTLVQHRQLDQLVTAESGAKGLGWLRQTGGRPTPVNFLNEAHLTCPPEF